MAISIASATGSLDQSLPTRIDAEFRLLMDANGVIRNCATKVPFPAHSGSSYERRNYGRVVATRLQDGVDLAQAQALQDFPTSISPSEAGVQVVVSGLTIRRSADSNIAGNASEICSRACLLLEDQLGLAALTSFTGSATMGAAGTVASPGIMTALFTRLMTGDNRVNPEPAPKPYYAPLHPFSILPLWGRMIPLATTPAGSTAYGVNTGAHAGVSVATGASSDADDMLKRGIGGVGMVGGGMVKADPNFTIDSNDDYTTAGFSQEGLLFVQEIPHQVKTETADLSMRGAIECNAFGSYNFGVFRPANYGIPLTLDASTPTS